MKPLFPLVGPTSTVEIRSCRPKPIPSHRSGPPHAASKKKFEMLPTVCAGAKKVGLGGGDGGGEVGRHSTGVFPSIQWNPNPRNIFPLQFPPTPFPSLCGETNALSEKFPLLISNSSVSLTQTANKQPLPFFLPFQAKKKSQPTKQKKNQKRRNRNSIIAFISRGFSRKDRSVRIALFVLNKKKKVDS